MSNFHSNPLKIIQEDSIVHEQTWYTQGLSFKCTGCGQCCTGAPGYVWISEQEAFAMADYLNLSIQKFMEKYVRIVDSKMALVEDPRNYDCVFLKDKKCQIYQERPLQCRTFPWWQQNLRSKEDWEKAATFCEGINKDAPVVSFKQIEEQLIQQNARDL